MRFFTITEDDLVHLDPNSKHCPLQAHYRSTTNFYTGADTIAPFRSFHDQFGANSPTELSTESYPKLWI